MPAAADTLRLTEHTLAGIRVRAHSTAGLATAIDLPEFRVAFDLGGAFEPLVARETIAFTHAHIDHLGAVCWHAAMRGMRGLAPPRYFVPRENVDDFDLLFEAWRRLDRSDLEHSRVALGPGEVHALRPDLDLVPFRSLHRVPCQGYGLHERREKLAARFQGLAPEELRRRRIAGEVLTETESTPLVAFTGDTRIEVVENEAVVRTAKLLILEVTFLDDRVSVAKARATGHVHLDEVCERADLFENEVLLLTHLSRRYRAHEVTQILARRLPASLAARAVPLLG